MARPIKETPILHGEDARVFEARMKILQRKAAKRWKKSIVTTII